MRRPAPIGGATPPEMSTGNEDDDELLKQIAARESLDKPRRWQHYLHVPTEQVAYGVAAPLDALGWPCTSCHRRPRATTSQHGA